MVTAHVMTLHGRLLRTLTAVLVLAFVALWLMLVLAIRHVSLSQMLMHLAHDGDAVLAALAPGDAGLALSRSAIEPVYEQPQSGHYFVLRVDGRDLARSGSLGSFALELPPPPEGGVEDHQLAGPAGQWLIVQARSVKVGPHQVTLFIGEDMSETRRVIRELGTLAVLLFAVVLAAALLLQRLVVRRALRPLDRVREELREVGAGRHAHIRGEVPLEVKPLVDELNRLLVVLQRRLNQSRVAVGNLAHAIKTPLATLMRAAEDPGVSDQARSRIDAQAQAIRQRLERELRRARVAGAAGVGAGALFNPAAELPALLQVLRSVHRDKPLDIALEAPDLQLPCDREDMLELVGNLADNACKWARSRVSIQVGQDAAGVWLAVADDGPGCTPEQAEDILRRGVRLDEGVAGHGLGLAIVKDIVEGYEGTLRLGRDEALGGLRIEARLAAPT